MRDGMRDGKNISNLSLNGEKVLISASRWSMVCLSLVLGPCAEVFSNCVKDWILTIDTWWLFSYKESLGFQDFEVKNRES